MISMKMKKKDPLGRSQIRWAEIQDSPVEAPRNIYAGNPSILDSHLQFIILKRIINHDSYEY